LSVSVHRCKVLFTLPPLELVVRSIECSFATEPHDAPAASAAIARWSRGYDRGAQRQDDPEVVHGVSEANCGST
jgi:hypothetical protein